MRISGAIALALFLAACATGAGPSPYGEAVRFAKGREVVFRDFSLRYLGKRQVSSPIFGPGFSFQDFEVKDARGAKTVSWSSGTGLIDAVSFEFNGKAFELELRASVAKKGWLREDEMVVWPAKAFREAQERRNRESR